jgi:hypothetical protein
MNVLSNIRKFILIYNKFYVTVEGPPYLPPCPLIGGGPKGFNDFTGFALAY